ncbi:3'(2'),5'-bisphosphate nucleotidase CysQ [Aureimonas mangrovi]|uniref:3'(2'),5'-bisphosphate nucleotidase CysQ n=1 Tax=Aureimonas mangrovi TaxID=2758041 RepID=UPI00163DA5A3|nr:3'(2'),5'-bisphosphate nucleotidase CysQ [Aureimonas mangrovi]
MAREEDDLELLIRAAREAGTIAMSFFRRDPQVFWKEGNSPVSQADLAVDGYLRDFLLSARPKYGWVSEETASEPPQGGETRFFVVDPIDGTRSFLRGEATWCVSLAIIEAGRPIVGVIDAPVAAEVFSATARGLPLLNGKSLSLEWREAGLPGEGEAVEDGRLVVSVPDAVRLRMREEDRDALEFHKAIPSLAYRLAMVASGRLAGTIVHPRANDWDIAAADLLIERAGGALLNERGERHLYKLNPRRHGLLVAGAGPALERMRRFADHLTADGLAGARPAQSKE